MGYKSRSRRGRSRTAALSRGAVPAGRAQICRRETQGLTDFPIQRIREQVQPDQNQQALLDELKVATQQALEILRSACPTDLPTTSTGRMAAMRVRVETMLRAVQVVRPVLEKFYASLSDEQKERFNALDAANLQTVSAKRQQPEIAHVCSGRAARAVDVPVARIEHTLHLSGAQADALRELKDASAKAADILAQNCPADQPLTRPAAWPPWSIGSGPCSRPSTPCSPRSRSSTIRSAMSRRRSSTGWTRTSHGAVEGPNDARRSPLTWRNGALSP